MDCSLDKILKKRAGMRNARYVNDSGNNKSLKLWSELEQDTTQLYVERSGRNRIT